MHDPNAGLKPRGYSTICKKCGTAGVPYGSKELGYHRCEPCNYNWFVDTSWRRKQKRHW